MAVATNGTESMTNGHGRHTNGKGSDEADAVTIPAWEDLPIRKDGPPYNAWGLYGPDDELGRLNLITPAVVRRGLASAEHGIVINLK